jgi:hypothetical protein
MMRNFAAAFNAHEVAAEIFRRPAGNEVARAVPSACGRTPRAATSDVTRARVGTPRTTFVVRLTANARSRRALTPPRPGSSQTVSFNAWRRINLISGFGLDARAELYVCDLDGDVFKIVAAP